MQNDCKENTLIKLREGTTQQARYKTLLDPENIQLMGFDVKDWMNFAEEFSKYVNLYTKNNHTVPTGNWEPFHNASEEIKKVIDTYAEGNVTPQLALFIAFLKLLNESKTRFNKITKRHLDFYYKEVLQLKKQAETPDHAYVIFELAKNASEQFLSDDTLLVAGKDSNGNTLHYQLNEEIVVNKAKVAAIKNTYYQEGEGNWHASEIADSGDGNGGEIANEGTSWLPFGDATRDLAKKGFSVSTPSLQLSEGIRTIIITAAYRKTLPVGNIKSLLNVTHTGEKDWIDITSFIKSAVTNGSKLTITIELTEDEEKITNYNAEVHQGTYNTQHPIVRVLFDPQDTSADTFEKYLKIATTVVRDVEVKTIGTYTAGLHVKNDLGKINTENPFLPFGPLAKKDAKLKISSEEWIGKRISDISLSLEWKDLPENFVTHYQHYKREYLNIAPSSTFTGVKAGTLTNIIQDANGKYRFRAFSDYIGSTKTVVQNITDQLSDEEAEKIKAELGLTAERAAKEEALKQAQQARIEQQNKIAAERVIKQKQEDLGRRLNEEEMAAVLDSFDFDDLPNDADAPPSSGNGTSAASSNPKNQPLFNGSGKVTFDNFMPPNVTYVPKASDEYLLQLTLQNDFLHDAYAKIYTYLAINELPLPNNPYTPLAENLQVTITTTETFATKYREVALYHELPFGTEKISRIGATLMPKPEKGGQLYIGIENAIADQNIQLLCQIEEGSENPDAIEQHGMASVTWQYLYKNNWKNLKPTFLLKDQTDNFLKAGLVAFTVPKKFNENTLFAEPYLWIRAIIDKPYDTVSKFANIHAQAAEIVFVNDNNTLEHLENDVPAETITKLEQRLATIKKVAQPYATFGGASQESSLDFYRRISERLRHKNRAVTLWDYEHLILQEFNYLHKVKCLNHSTRDSFQSPGEVLLVAIPNIVDQNVYDLYKPKLSQTKLNAIQNYINKLNTMHVDAKVISPEYEEVTFSLKARFHDGLDANYYSKMLKKDMTQYLSPWAFDKSKAIPFGNAMYASEVIFYIENLEYVDYIKDFKMMHFGKEKDEIIPTDQKSILTSVAQQMHSVEAITKTLCQQ